MASYVYGGTATANLTFVGQGGSDAFIGGYGNDVAIGGTGGDYMDSGAGNNTLSYAGSLGGVSINLLAGTASGGDATGDYFLNFQNVNGSTANDTLYGDKTTNKLFCDASNDTLVGYGGIADFTIGQDQIYLSTALAANFPTLQFYLFQSGANVLVAFGPDTIQIDNTTIASLHATDFVFF